MAIYLVAGPVLFLIGCSVAVPPLPKTLPTVAAVTPTPEVVRALAPSMTSEPSPAATASIQIESRPTTFHLETPSVRPSSTPVVSPEPTDRPTESPTGTLTLPAGTSALIVRRGVTTAKVVALTYDAGADRGQTASLLAYLLGASVNVTFGMTGRWAETNPDLVRRMVADGHELMNHTYDHRSFTGHSANPAILRFQDRVDEITRAETIIHTISGATTKPLFRPPYGDEDAGVLQAVAAAGYRYSVLWTVDSLGWRGASVAEIVDRCLRNAQDGAIYVLHVGAGSRDIDATKQIVEGLRAQGYRFETVGQLIAATGR